MRKKLAPFRNQFILARGWIDSWEDLDDCRRVFVKQPTIRIPDKHLLFDKQKTISTEHHLNLFIPHKHLPNFDTIWEQHNKISFSGYINYYTRSDGSKDYAINTDEQSTILFELETICAAVMDVLSNRTLNTRDDCFLTDYALSKVKELNIKLEGYGNNLPTFKHTYSWYKETINKIEKLIDICIKSLVTMRSNRAYRRAFKKSKSTLKEHIFM